MTDDEGAVTTDFETFCVDAWPRLVAALAHYCGDPRLAEEFAQDALIRAGDRWKRVGQMASPAGWTFRVGANLAKSHFRRKSAERRAYARYGAPPDVAADTADALAVRESLQELPDRQRQAIVLRYYLDLSPDEAGDVMGISGQAVRNLVHRAVSSLRDEFLTEEVRDVH